MAIVRKLGVCAALCLGLAMPAWAVTLGQASSFEGASTEGWTSGDFNPNPPMLVSTGGPAGGGDGYLLLTSSGVHGPGGKMVALAGSDWLGDYLAAGVGGIEMDLNNFGSTELSLRLWLVGAPGSAAVSLAPVLLPAGSGWAHVSFALSAQALEGAAEATLAGVTQLRLYHGSTTLFPGEDIAGSLGVDNITAVPEPAAALLFAAGALALGLHRRRNAGATPPLPSAASPSRRTA